MKKKAIDCKAEAEAFDASSGAAPLTNIMQSMTLKSCQSVEEQALGAEQRRLERRRRVATSGSGKNRGAAKAVYNQVGPGA